MRLFLTGDVMLGRGIDQILRHPGDPRLYESFANSAVDYVALAEDVNGSIPRGIGLDYVWGDASEVVTAAWPDFGIVNLETAITDDGLPAPKGINYRLSRRNASGLKGLGISCCVLSNNHVLDWGQQALIDTLDSLHRQSIATAGAGRTASEAAAPALLRRGDGRRALVFGMACMDSGVPLSWIAEGGRPGIRLLERLDDSEFHAIKSQVRALKQEGDIAIASIHWGENWGFDIPRMHRSFAHALIDEAAIDLVHGHSSHHAKGWEVYEEKLILYGCGDFINDYEGIAGNSEYCSDIVAMYLVELSDDAKASLLSMAICPFNIRQFRLRRAKWTDANWLCDTLNRERRSPGWQLSLSSDGMLRLTDAFS